MLCILSKVLVCFVKFEEETELPGVDGEGENKFILSDGDLRNSLRWNQEDFVNTVTVYKQNGWSLILG